MAGELKNSMEITAALIGAGAAIVGGVVSGILSGIYGHIRDWFTRPKLQLDFLDMGPANVIDIGWTEGGRQVERVIVRASVKNAGKRAARNCNVHLIQLEEVQAGGGVVQTNFHDSMVLTWAGGQYSPRDVSRAVTHYVDIVRVRKDSSGWDFAFGNPLASHERLKTYRGTYRFTLVATADNAEPAYCSVDVSYDGDWHSLRAVKT